MFIAALNLLLEIWKQRKHLRTGGVVGWIAQDGNTVAHVWSTELTVICHSHEAVQVCEVPSQRVTGTAMGARPSQMATEERTVQCGSPTKAACALSSGDRMGSCRLSGLGRLLWGPCQPFPEAESTCVLVLSSGQTLWPPAELCFIPFSSFHADRCAFLIVYLAPQPPQESSF